MLSRIWAFVTGHAINLCSRLKPTDRSDPDAPSPNNPSHREYLHWMVVNVPGDASNIAGGHQVVPYAPPTPPKGNHRYVFSAFEQPTAGGPLTVHAPAARGKFNTQVWLKSSWGVVVSTFSCSGLLLTLHVQSHDYRRLPRRSGWSSWGRRSSRPRTRLSEKARAERTGKGRDHRIRRERMCAA